VSKFVGYDSKEDCRVNYLKGNIPQVMQGMKKYNFGYKNL
jgi:hypothetical protein